MFNSALTSTQVATLYQDAGYGPQVSGQAYYPDVVMSYNPVGYWPMTKVNANGGISDISGNHNDGNMNVEYNGHYSISSAPMASYLGSVYLGGYGDNNGLQTYVQTTNYSQEYSSLTYSALINTTASGGGVILSLDNGQNSFSFSDWQLYMTPSGQIAWGVNGNGAYPVITSPSSYNNGVWHQIVATYSATSGFALYIDGSLVGTNATTVGSTEPYYWFWIGDGNTGGWPGGGNNEYQGNLSNVAIFDSTLTSAQVATLYQDSGVVTTPTLDYQDAMMNDNPISYWPLTSVGAGESFNDVSGYNNTGYGAGNIFDQYAGGPLLTTGNVSIPGIGIGTPVSLVPSATCGVGTNPVFQFTYTAPGSSTPVIISNGWQNSPSIWSTAGLSPGTYTITMETNSFGKTMPDAGATPVTQSFQIAGWNANLTQTNPEVSTGQADTFTTTLPGPLDDTPGSVSIYAYPQPLITSPSLYAQYGASSMWSLAETSGSIAYDTIGNDNGVISSGVTLNGTTGPNGEPAMTFNGSGSIVTSAPSTTSDGSFTISGWVNLSTLSPSAPEFIAYNGTQSNGYGLAIDTNGTPVIYYAPGGWVYSNTQLPGINQWVFVAATYNGNGNNAFYINGQETNPGNIGWSGGSPNPQGAPTTHARVGLGNGNYYMNGAMAQVAIFPTALTPTQIANLYAYGSQYQAITPIILNTCTTGISCGASLSETTPGAYDIYAVTTINNNNYVGNTVTMQVGPSCIDPTLTASPVSPQPDDTNITLTATSSCSSGITPEYQFEATNPSGATSVLQAYSTANSVVWNQPEAGNWTLTVYSESSGASGSQGGAEIPYTVNFVPTISLSTSNASVTQGQSYTLTATLGGALQNSGYTADIYQGTPDGSVKAALANSPSSFWPLNETSGSTAADTSGNNNTGFLQGGVAFNAATTPQGYPAMGFNGNSSYISTTTSYNGPDVYSISAWFNTTANNGGLIAQFDSQQTGAGGNYDRQIYVGTDGLLYFGEFNGGTFTINSPAPVNDGKWHFVVAVSTGTEMYLYLDGSLVANQAYTEGQSFTGYWRIGGGGSGGWLNEGSTWFDGAISQVGIFPSALTSAQIAGMYILPSLLNTCTTGTTCSYTATPASPGVYDYFSTLTGPTAVTSNTVQEVVGPVCYNPTLSTSGSSPQMEGASLTLTATASCSSGNTPQYEFFYAPIGNNPPVQIGGSGWSATPSVTWNTTNLGGSIYNVYVDVTANGQTATQASAQTSLELQTAYSAYMESLAPTAYWQLSDVGGTNAYDFSGNNNAATLQSGVGENATPSPVVGQGEGGMSFNGSSQYLSTATNYTGPNVYTIAAWFKTTSTNGGIIIQFDGAQYAGGGGGYDRELYVGTDGTLYFGECCGVTTINSSQLVDNGAWHFAVGVSNGSSMQLYLDGALVASNSFGENQGMTGWWRIGYGNPNGWPNTGTGWFTGDLSQVAVLPVALTAAQIQTLYMYHNGPGCYNPTLTASPPAAASPGTTVTLSASSSCSPGETPEYAFYATPQGGSQTTLQAMSSSSTYNWNTSGMAVGTSYTISVQSQGSTTATPQGSTSIPYAFTSSAAAAYAQTAATDGASAYWPLWETSGTTAQELIANNNGVLSTGVTVNATTAPNGSPAMNFNGTGGYISTSFAQPSTTGYSIAAWFNSTSATTMQVIASARDGSNFNDSFAISLGGTYNAQTPGSLAFYLDGTSFVDGIQSTGTSYDNGQWYFVVGTWSAASGTSFNPSQMTLYVDGAVVTTTNLGSGGEFTSPVPGGGAMDLGSNGANWNYYNGDLAQVTIFPTALTPTQVNALYADG